DVIAIADDAPLTMLGRQTRFGDAMHESLGLEPVGDQLGNGDECDAMLPGEALELRTPSGRAILVEDLADHAGGGESGESREIDRGFGVTDTLQHTALARGAGTRGHHGEGRRPSSRDRRRRESSSPD